MSGRRCRARARAAWRAVWSLLWAAVLGLLAPAWAEVRVIDDQGVEVRLMQPPQRIVSLLPSLSEAVCELGQCARLVGVDRYTNWPPALAAVPRVGGGLDPNIEAIVALRPDVVLAATSSRAIERLRALGLPVVALEPKTHEDVQRVLLKLGQLLQVPDAARVWRAIDAAVSAAAQALPPSARGLRVYVEVSPGPYAAGEASFIGQTLQRLGARNVVPAALGPFPKLNPEFIVRADPDVILVSARAAEGLAQRPGWFRLRAVQHDRVCAFDATQSDVLVRPGPRMAEAARLMADCLVRAARSSPVTGGSAAGGSR
ncbi:MAG: helical backbone metal receptor [Tepidimonas sp.]|uniref:ABC transporter substrate-binding protein n=1 Tax=Tepidimonas sp. TaxID=2002775 RepID=UPI00298EFC6C|nr:helical backbone metal receptor [Tepidimonas sp.]MCS6810796.1 helical backbone metal receptor [Tepidimonas sp.]MDW8335911.1 helical backbone metal receptor [Tepidimonas sp.]